MFIKMFDDILNSEGPICAIYRCQRTNKLYLRGLCLNNGIYIYSELNFFALEMYFQSQITLNQLFRLQNDRKYLIVNPYTKKQAYVLNDYDFQQHILNQTIQCGNLYYNEIPAGMSNENSFNEIISILRQMQYYPKMDGNELVISGKRFMDGLPDFLRSKV